MRKYVISAFADEYSPETEKQLIAMNVFDITHIEPRFLDKKNVSDLTEDEAYAVKALFDKYGIKINSIGSPIGKIKLDGDMEAHKKKTEHVCRIANIFGAKYEKKAELAGGIILILLGIKILLEDLGVIDLPI